MAKSKAGKKNTDAQPDKGGRPEKTANEKERAIVEVMAAGGIPQELIAACMKMSINTLKKLFVDELATAKTRLDAEVIGQLIKKIRAGDTACIIFYLKTRMKWQEQAPQEDDHEKVRKIKQALQEMDNSVPAPDA